MLPLNPENERYSCKCQNTVEDGIIVELQIYNITREDHKSTWICEVLSSSTRLKKKAFVFVKVSVKTVEIRPSRTIIQISENSSYQFTCTSSIGRPVPKIFLIVAEEINQGKRLTILDNHDQSDHKDTTGGKMSYANSTFLYSPNRTVNGWKLFCSVEETKIQTKVQSDPIQLNITYPPESRLIINGLFNEGTYKVIENSTGLLNCTIIGGNPAPIVSWTTCFETDKSSLKYSSTSMEIYSDVLKWKAKPDTDMKCTCDCTQMEQNQSLSINVQIIYPPRLPTMTSGNEVLTGHISVLINTLLRLNCTSDSKPSSKYKWRFNNVHLSDGQHYGKQSQKADQGLYTCVATNVLEPTDGIARLVSSNTSFELHILYPPTIGKIVDQTIVEGDALNISCPVIRGNPNNTQIKWTTSMEIGEKWLTQFLVISNVSRKHDMEYICTVNNTMASTFEPVETGLDSESFHLTIEYKSAVKAFFIDGYYQQTNITVNESDNLLFRCHIESKPISTTSIHFESGEALDVSQSNDISYNIRSVACQQAGIYVCSGRNKHNGQDMAKQTLFISINCAPRPDSNYPVTKSITVSLNESASLHFTAIAYPKPKNVLWQKHNGDVWIDINSTNNINLNRSDLNFSLDIKAIVQESYGIYRLIIVNKFGSFEQLFFINGVNSEHEYNPNVASYIAVGVGTFAVTVLAFILSIVAFNCTR
ncbi:hemicentin-1-like [Ruditapes philippinarum]|uniref:hemicentin-1-like n=1 Tax=Ruditapes philippinarum TaxID=129788 RepID=UPI00295A7E97|nr:hemicentin-1-like [Ruditapes philippinarum]